MVSKHRTDNDPIKNNFKTRKKKLPDISCPTCSASKKKKEKPVDMLKEQDNMTAL